MVLIKYYLFINLFLEFGTYLLPAVMFWLDTQVCWVNVDESTSSLFIVLRYFKRHLNALFYRQKKNLSHFLPIKTTQENLSRKAASPPITRITNLDRFDHEVEFMNPKSI